MTKEVVPLLKCNINKEKLVKTLRNKGLNYLIERKWNEINIIIEKTLDMRMRQEKKFVKELKKRINKETKKLEKFCKKNGCFTCCCLKRLRKVEQDINEVFGKNA